MPLKLSQLGRREFTTTDNGTSTVYKINAQKFVVPKIIDKLEKEEELELVKVQPEKTKFVYSSCDSTSDEEIMKKKNGIKDEEPEVDQK